MNLADIGQLVHARRIALGLSQARLATMSGLSRATINQLETGSLVDLGAAKLISLLDLVGINLDGALPKEITPHVSTLLDEAPLSLIVATVEEVASASNISPKLLWKHVFNWAKDLHSPRGVWA